MKRSTRKKDEKAKRQSRQPDPTIKRGFRKMVIGDAIYSWRYYGDRVEIRPPGKIQIKWLVPIWQLQEFESKEAWEDGHTEDHWEQCSCFWIAPRAVRKYIDDMRKVTC